MKADRYGITGGEECLRRGEVLVGREVEDDRLARLIAGWVGKLENNILTRADHPKPWHKCKGRCQTVLFKQQTLFAPTADPEGAAMSRSARAWARVEAKLLELQALRNKENKGNPTPEKTKI